MTTWRNTSQAMAKELDQMAIAGVAKYLASAAKITLAGNDYTAATLTHALQSEIDSIMALASARAQLAKQVADNQTLSEDTQTLRTALRGYLVATYGTAAVQVLGDFGMKVAKPSGPRTAEVKARSAAKASATRKARAAALKAVGTVAPTASGTSGK